MHVLGMRDLAAIRLSGAFRVLEVWDIYNDCLNSDAIECLNVRSNTPTSGRRAWGESQAIWCGDFNRHHPMWDEERNGHLFMAAALSEAGRLLEIVAEHSMMMALPKDIPTLESMATKNWTRPDNVFCTPGLMDKLIFFVTEPQL